MHYYAWFPSYCSLQHFETERSLRGSFYKLGSLGLCRICICFAFAIVGCREEWDWQQEYA